MTTAINCGDDMKTCTEQKFLHDVSGHTLTVLRDDGLYRHLRFRRPSDPYESFDILTWPGYLCYTGDMGTFVFRRIEDMLEFFRKPGWGKKEGKLYINPKYWSEKLEGVDRCDGVTEYSPDLFRQKVLEYLDAASDDLVQEVQDNVLCHADDGEFVARDAVNNFEYPGFEFTDFHEVDLTVYTYRFLWCCYALAWAITKYDEYKGLKDEAA